MVSNAASAQRFVPDAKMTAMHSKKQFGKASIAFILSENMRASGDPAFARIQRMVREASLTDDCPEMQLLEQQHVQSLNDDRVRQFVDDGAIVIHSTNDVVDVINQLHAQKFAAESGRVPDIFTADDYVGRRKNKERQVLPETTQVKKKKKFTKH